MRTLTVWLVLFLAGLLVGFIPQYLKVRDLKRQGKVCNAAYQLGEARRAAALAYVSASYLNYGNATTYGCAFFEQVRQLAATTSGVSGHSMLTVVLSSSTQSMAGLGK